MKARGVAHLVGIGGIGMSGIARMYLSMGYRVQGSDLKRSDILSSLEKRGVKIFIGHDAAHVKEADWVVYSSSISENHPERLAARGAGKRVIHRAEALAELCRGKFTIAVTGTHGKTTTTALIGTVLAAAGRDPSIVVGGLVLSLGTNVVVGAGNEIVIEADESDSSFLKFSPAIEVITNIEAEHMDHFEDIGRVEAAYRGFLGRLPEKGKWFGCAEDARVLGLAREGLRRATLYGFEKVAEGIYATEVTECPGGKRGVSFKAWKGDSRLGAVRTRLMGRHNVLNALAAVGVGLELGVPFAVISQALEGYEGTARRFDVKFEDHEYLVVDDYAHHPTEVQKTLAAAKALGRKRIFAFFQPHRYTRAKAFLEEFAASFSDADKVVVTDIYAAGERPLADVDGSKVCEAVKRRGHPDAVYVPRPVIADYAKSEIRPGDLLITLGAGDVYQTAAEVAEVLRLRVFKELRGKVLRREPLSKHTSLKVGGPAEFWIEPEDAEDLRNAIRICRRNGIAVYLIGSGSNLLPPDEGLRGAAIHLSSPYFRGIWMEGDKIAARAGVQNALFIQYALERGFGGCEFLLGIPGSIGGSLAMNAGSHRQSIGALVESLTVMDTDGSSRILRKTEVPFSYRHSGIGEAVILEAVFSLPRCDREAVRNKLEEYRNYRLKTQDLRHPSAGCMFKNPKDHECSSGKLIEEAGLKGRRIGNAQVSTKHANFIINLGGASSNDISLLIEEVRNTVKAKFNVDLEPEVRMIR